MDVLIACEESGKVRESFRKRGHEAWSCDLVPSRDDSPYHLQMDAIEAAYTLPWDLMIAHPECTYLTNCAALHLYKDKKKVNGDNGERWAKMGAAASFFLALWNAPIPKIAIENPVMLGHPKRIFGIPEQTQIIHPWQHGHGEQKHTCLWLKNLPKITPTNIVEGREQRIWLMSPNPNRSRDRSETYQGIADAFAEQWG